MMLNKLILKTGMIKRGKEFLCKSFKTHVTFSLKGGFSEKVLFLISSEMNKIYGIFYIIN